MILVCLSIGREFGLLFVQTLSPSYRSLVLCADGFAAGAMSAMPPVFQGH